MSASRLTLKRDIAPLAIRIKTLCSDGRHTYHSEQSGAALISLPAMQPEHVPVRNDIRKNGFDLIIFDCDGVLVDSEVISTQTLLEALAANGLVVDIEYVRNTYLGRSIAVVKSDYHRRMGRELVETFEGDFMARLFAAYSARLVPMAGVEELLASLAVPFCMATSSSIERATVSLEITGLLPLFEGRIFCASMVPRGKPAPDLFLHAAATLGAEPSRCLVVEDSEVGVLAARNAGMSVWRFLGGSHFRDSAELAIAVESGVPVFHSMAAMAVALRNH